MAEARLRVAVPAGLDALPAHTGAGRVWARGLGLLADRVRLDRRAPGGRRLLARAPAVWLADGHMGALPVDEPVVVHLHEASFADPALRPLIAPEFLDLYERPTAEAAAAAAAILTVSESSRSQIASAYGVPPERIHVAPLGVDHAVYRPSAAPLAEEVLRRAGADPERPYVLFVSQLHPRKNLAALREAMGVLAGQGLPHSLVVVGHDPADRPDPDGVVAEALAPIPGVPVIRVPGPSDEEVAALMAAAACFCLPSLMEGFGLAAAEAMACGAPVVVSDRGSLPEVVGDAGVVVAPEAGAVAEGLASVLADPETAARLRRASVERAAGFTWERMAERWHEVLRAVAAGRG
ncbi:MAG TPA: glycosyltransferase [Thermoleophilaceae bacterium]|nr:glycosyltransferase [Thermoleophilaceae bacterium]